jgi:hypothetical protein
VGCRWHHASQRRGGEVADSGCGGKGPSHRSHVAPALYQFIGRPLPIHGPLYQFMKERETAPGDVTEVTIASTARPACKTAKIQPGT